MSTTSDPSDPPTALSLPPNLPYPITITRLHAHPGQPIHRGTKLIDYTFLSTTRRKEMERRAVAGDERRNHLEEGGDDWMIKDDMVGTWESPITGECIGWESWIGNDTATSTLSGKGVSVSVKVERRQASRTILKIRQPCSHPVQIHGLCGICGMDLTTDDYLSSSISATGNDGGEYNAAGPSNYAEGAVGFEIAHDALGVTVSSHEAKRLENLTRDTLLSTRRLSLIVDLDQTIIHTTVDPTVGEWMAEIDEHDGVPSQDDKESSPSSSSSSSIPALSRTHTRHQTQEVVKLADGSLTRPTTTMDTKPPEGNQDTKATPTTTTPPGSPEHSTVPLPLGHTQSGNTAPKRRREKNPNEDALKDVARFQLVDDMPPGYRPPRSQRGIRIQQEGRWYYTKPRPGLAKFMEKMSRLYEMHVYTMGTRSYADAICKVIDPDGRIFGGRVLSRDESGSLSSKSLTRLFPTDQSMVVVIDDRSDVWDDCPNLVKVVPYDFFLGIGDINGSFLPTPATIPSGPGLPTATPSTISPSTPRPTTSKEQTSSPSGSSPMTTTTTTSSPLPTTPSESLSTEEEGMLIHAKLLDQVSEARPLAKLQEELENHQDGPEGLVERIAAADSASADDSTDSKDLLSASSDSGGSSLSTPRKPLLNDSDNELERISSILVRVHHDFYRAYDDRTDPSDIPLGCDAGMIISEMKSKVFEGCHLVFSGIIPRHIPSESFALWRQAEDFGAICHDQVTSLLTHCVTANLGTEKTYKASKVAKARIVWVEWLLKSIALWEKQSETLYLAKAADTNDFNNAGESTSTVSVNGRTVAEGEIDGSSSQDKGDDIPGGSTDESEGVNGSIAEVEGGETQFDDDDFAEAAEGWDAEAQAELDAFLEGSSDYGGTEDGAATEDGDVESEVESVPPTPGTPRKRVRYADEESLPLESFKDPSPNDDPPHKRRKPYLLPPPTSDDDIPEKNRLIYKSSSSIKSEEEEKGVMSSGKGAEVVEAAKENHQVVEEEEEDEDEFAQMLMESLGDVSPSDDRK